MDQAETGQPSASGTSGKVVIVGILTVALVAAATSWYFRYNATHRAAKFWGTDSALIRDAAEVALYKEPIVATDKLGVEYAAIPAAMQAHIRDSAIDISRAPGILHLRNALLEDANFVWPASDKPQTKPMDNYWWLKFRDPKSGTETWIKFTQDCRQGLKHTLRSDGKWEATVFSAEPMAKGLREMFAEFSAVSPTPSAGPAR